MEKETDLKEHALKRGEQLRDIAKYLDQALQEMYGHKMAFLVLATPMDAEVLAPESRIADYFSNAERESGIKWMKETIERFEDGEGYHFDGNNPPPRGASDK
jgi:hypothetical protein